jgi:drug/metabolite transporter (DMT)-like permease
MSEEYGPPANTSTRLERAVLLIGMALGAVAVALVLFSVSPTSLGDLPWIAVALGLAAGAAYGFYSAFSSTISADQQFRFLVLSSISGMLVLLPFSLPELGSLHEVPPLSLAITILFGIVMDGVGYFVWTRAVAEARRQAIPIEKVTSIIYLLPVLSVIIIQAVFPAPDINLVLGLSGIALLSFSSALCQKPEIASRFFKRYRV